MTLLPPGHEGRPALHRVAATSDSAGNHRADAENLRQQCARLIFRDPRPESRHVAAGNVPAFMGDDTDDLIWSVCLHQRAGMDEHVAAIENERIEGVVIDDADDDAAAAESRGLEDGPRVVLQQRLDLGVTDEWQSLSAYPARRRQKRDKDQAGRKHYASAGRERRKSPPNYRHSMCPDIDERFETPRAGQTRRQARRGQMRRK